MVTVNTFIVEFEQSYIDKMEHGSLSLHLVNDLDNVHEINRECILRGLPYGYEGELEVGMRLIVHHNMARVSKNYQDKKVSEYKISKNLYRVPMNLVFLYFKDGKWNSYGEWCFVKPLEVDNSDKVLDFGLIIPSVVQDKYAELRGVMRYPNKSLDVKEGEVVQYLPYSEHKYTLEGEVLYKMNIDRVLFVVPNE